MFQNLWLKLGMEWTTCSSKVENQAPFENHTPPCIISNHYFHLCDLKSLDEGVQNETVLTIPSIWWTLVGSFLSNGVRLPKEILAFARAENGGRVQHGMWFWTFHTRHAKLERIQDTGSLTGHTLAPRTHVPFVLLMHKQAFVTLNTLAQLPWKRLWQAGGYAECVVVLGGV